MGLKADGAGTAAEPARRDRWVRWSVALGLLGIGLLVAIPTFGTRSRTHGVGVCRYEIVSRAPTWMWVVAVISLALANLSLARARGAPSRDTRATHGLAWALGLALLTASVWLVWANLGYRHGVCNY